ncbi:hypothetical protein EYF80_013299 [Liparis tanakae]|uniref:Uncharacterized protein n=1 Tax=Liparis tanakae TaxID=230148 RepID=A0A4Z2IG88_9TELE|nr:hypothetical protein EYF80_013299 [Liparis tanakae]
MSAWVRSRPALFGFVGVIPLLENRLLMDLLLDDFFLLTVGVGAETSPLSEASAPEGPSSIGGGPSCSSSFSSPLPLREKIPRKLFQSEGFLFFLGFLAGFSDSTGRVSGCSGSTAENVPIFPSFSPPPKRPAGLSLGVGVETRASCDGYRTLRSASTLPALGPSAHVLHTSLPSCLTWSRYELGSASYSWRPRFTDRDVKGGLWAPERNPVGPG